MILKLKLKKLKDLYNSERQNYIKFNENKIYVDKFPLNIVYLAEINKIFSNGVKDTKEECIFGSG